MLAADWLETPEGSSILQSLCVGEGCGLRTYGLLERPVLPLSCHMEEEAHYKLVLVGKSGVGKSSTVAHLTGHPVNTAAHAETAGIQTTKTYWPVKVARLNKKVLMKLTFWDAGEVALRKFDHILPACRSGMDGVLFVFSFVDKGSWDELPHLMTQLTDPGDRMAKVVIGTKFDQFSHSEVTQRELRDFESRWGVPVVKLSNTPPSQMDDVVPVMNKICEMLVQRDVSHAEAV